LWDRNVLPVDKVGGSGGRLNGRKDPGSSGTDPGDEGEKRRREEGLDREGVGMSDPMELHDVGRSRLSSSAHVTTLGQGGINLIGLLSKRSDA
jgi:hypothetical protein